MIEHIVYINNIEDIVIAKYFIEKRLIERKEIDEKMPLQDFIGNFLHMNQMLAVFDINNTVDVVLFYIYTIDNDRYIFFVDKNDSVNRILRKLSSIDYDFSKLLLFDNNIDNDMIRINNVEYSFR